MMRIAGAVIVSEDEVRRLLRLYNDRYNINMEMYWLKNVSSDEDEVWIVATRMLYVNWRFARNCTSTGGANV